MQESRPRIRNYEAVIITHPDITDEEKKSLFQKNKEIIKNSGGEIHTLNTWGKRYLMNPIKKQSRGVYFHTYFTAESQTISELERVMKINERVFRVVHTVLDERESLDKHLEKFNNAIQETANREKEREAKAQARKMNRREHSDRGQTSH